MATASSDRRRRKTDEAIRRAFSELLSEKDFSAITVSELAARADIDRKTFYLRYESLDAYVDSLLREEIVHLAEVLAASTIDENGALDIPALFEGLSAELVLSFNTRSAELRHMDTDMVISRLKPVLASVLAERDSFGLAKILGPYFGFFASYFCSGILSLYHQWAESESELPMETLALLTGSAVAGGIAAVTQTARELGIGGEAPA